MSQTMQSDFLSQVKTLYNNGLSAMEISKKMECSPHKIVYWMKKEAVPRRSLREALYRKYNPAGDPFRIKEMQTIGDAKLFGLGIGIYWGEGNKVDRNSVRVANSDLDVILCFVRFLSDICGIQKEKIRFSIVCFNDSDIETVSQYWSKSLGVSEEKFGKIVQIAPQGKGTYKRKSHYGVCTVAVYNTKLKDWLMNELDSLRSPR